MAGALIGAVRVVLGLDAAQFNSGLTAAQKQLRGVGKQMQAVGSQMASVGAGMTLAITGPLIAAGFAASKAANEAKDAMAQVEASLKSMGDASGQTKESLAGMASDIMRNSLYDDDDILRKVTANLLTFGNVAGDEFRRAQIAAADLATKMGTDLQPATLLIGKALNDPIKGLTAMGKAGIQFTDAQKAMIKTMVATGNVAGAQRIILGELEKQFAGSAKAAQDADPYDSLRDSLNDLSESVGGIINLYLKPFIDSLTRLANSFNALSPSMQQFAVIGGIVAAAIGPALVVIGSLVSAIGSLAVAFAAGGILAGLGAFVVAAAPFIAAAAAIGAAIWIFRDDLGPIFKEFAKVVSETLGPPLQALIAAASEMFALMGQRLGQLWTVVRPVLAAMRQAFMEHFGPKVVAMFRILAAGVTNAFAIIAQVFRVITALLKGDWTGAWNAVGSLVGEIVLGIGRIIDAVFPGSLATITRMVDGVKRIFEGPLFAVFKGAIDKIKGVGDAFFQLYDRVVGHSYIPDMVDEIGQHMARLDAALVRPVTQATQTAAERFRELQERASASMEALLTDRERLDRELGKDLAEYHTQLQGGAITQAAYDAMVRRRRTDYQIERNGQDAENLEAPKVGDLEGFGLDRLQDKWRETQERIADTVARSRENFADAFAGGMEDALRGDWSSLLRNIFGPMLQDSLRSLGGKLFDMGGGGGSGGFSWGSLASAVTKSFKLPGFANEGTIKAGGTGGIDSQLVSFWKSPSEQVDIYDPNRDGGSGGGSPLHFDLRGALMTADILGQMQEMASATGGAAFSGARKAVPSDMARTSRYKRGRS